MEEYKKDFEEKFNSLPEERKSEILTFYDFRSPVQFIRLAKEKAQDIIDYADKKGYGYGEVGYNINEDIKDFAEDAPELEKEYKRLINGYFDLLVEAKEA